MAEKKIQPKNKQKAIKKSTRKKQTDRPLTIKEKAFCREYIKSGNGNEAVRKAGYKPTSIGSGSAIATRLLNKVQIQQEISRLTEKREQKAIMDAQEVMELFSAIARGEVKDQFGLDASLNDRLKAMNEIAKRTVDIENRIKGVPDNNITIKLDWGE
jgi:phage terminase small subunit